jgi:hypothetical protein
MMQRNAHHALAGTTWVAHHQTSVYHVIQLVVLVADQQIISVLLANLSDILQQEINACLAI